MIDASPGIDSQTALWALAITRLNFRITGGGDAYGFLRQVAQMSDQISERKDNFQRIDELCDALEDAWQAGKRPSIAEYMNDLPEEVVSTALVELVKVELHYRREAREAPTAKEYYGRFPDHTKVLAPLFVEETISDFGTIVIFTVVQGPNLGLTKAFDRHASFLVGRAVDAHFRLPEDDLRVSRRHFLVEVNPPQCRVVDLKSKNKMKINGTEMAEAELRDGDRIEVGDTTFLVIIRHDLQGATLPPEATLEPATEHSTPDAQETGHEPGTAEPDKKTSAPPAISGYRFLDKLGEGGMGSVYLVESEEEDGSTLALKMIPPAVTPT